MPKKASGSIKSVETLKHGDAKRKNISSVEQQSVIQKEHSQAKSIR